MSLVKLLTKLKDNFKTFLSNVNFSVGFFASFASKDTSETQATTEEEKQTTPVLVPVPNPLMLPSQKEFEQTNSPPCDENETTEAGKNTNPWKFVAKLFTGLIVCITLLALLAVIGFIVIAYVVYHTHK